MQKLIFATGNPNKVEEVQQLLEDQFSLGGLSDIGCREELPENQDTLEGNALEKARYVYDNYGYDCFAEDTGLEVKALGGKPGVHTARYAGDGKNAEANMNKLLEELEGKSDRRAQFRTVIALIIGGEEKLFEGIAEGEIISSKKGRGGFGYDPVFQPLGKEKTFAQMDAKEKNELSHRGRAIRKLVHYLDASGISQ